MFDSLEITPNDTFILRIFCYKGLFDSDSFVLRVNSNYFSNIEEIESLVYEWLDELNLKFFKKDEKTFLRHLHSLFFLI